MAKITRFAVVAHEVAQGRAASCNRFIQDVADMADEGGKTLFADAPSSPLGMDRGTKQGFTRIDVADPDDNMRIHNKVFHRHTAALSQAVYVARGETIVEGFGPETTQ